MRDELVGAAAAKFQIGKPMTAIAHLTDLHVTDVQSPARFEFVNREVLDPRFRELLPMQRPQEALNLHVIASMLRTINGIAAAPLTASLLELAVMSGDAVDNAQWNELRTFLALFDGGRVSVDSGGPRYEGVQSAGWPDDIFWKPEGSTSGGDQFRDAFGYPLVPGLLERAMQPFDAEGLRLPWLGCHGNHEEVCQGVGIVTPALAAAMVGFHKPYRMPEGIDPDLALETFVHSPEAFMTGSDIPVTPDPDRRPLARAEFVDAHTGHGFTGGQSHYVYDAAAVRFMVLDTVCSGGGAHGCIDEERVAWLQQQLEETPSDRLVVIVSHHTSSTLNNTRGPLRARYVDVHELVAVLHRFDNVVLWLNGHVHANLVQVHPHPVGGGSGFWEVTTSSLVDWPSQARLVEIFEAGDGLLAIGCTMVDHDSPLDGGAATTPGELAGLHRELAANVPVVGFGGWREGGPLDRNVILLVRRPL